MTCLRELYVRNSAVRCLRFFSGQLGSEVADPTCDGLLASNVNQITEATRQRWPPGSMNGLIRIWRFGCSTPVHETGTSFRDLSSQQVGKPSRSQAKRILSLFISNFGIFWSED
ncbi:unnamed protein product [Protopolystoma xenopodis]|uniref:Uncharacterized protein n=1 Tax=Protopolystoma xenopodis TaxID=117903 RepID=A0A448WUU0_9PLAT|nr:unnamed protein product [Protopolystoma xenopodis]